MYTVRTDPAPDPELLNAILTVASSAKNVEGDLEVHLGLEADVDRVLDLIRARGIGVRALLPKKRSLEEVFLATVDKESAEEEGGS